MRKVLLAGCGVLVAMVALKAEAKQPYGMAGCGLGSMIFTNDSGQISAATTNQSSYQSFAITSGTSNCLEPSQWAALETQQNYISSNFSTLSKEIAQGEGESIEGLAETFGCQESVYPEFKGQMQRSYERIFKAPGSQAALSVIKAELRSNAVLNQSCDTII